MGGTEEASEPGVTPDQPDTTDIKYACGTRPAVVVRNSQGVQVVLGGQGAQTSNFGGVTPQASPDEFRADLLTLLTAVDESARKANLPPYLRPGSDVIQMARTVRLLGRVRRPEDAAGTADPGQNADREHVYELPAERDRRADEPPQPWEQAAARFEQLVVLGDPGMGKSWLLRTQTHRLVQAALVGMRDGAIVSEETAIPIPVRADVLAARAEGALAEAVTRYLVDEGLLAIRSAAEMTNRIANGGVTLLIDALDEVPREAAVPGTQAPLKRLEDMLRQWALQCTGPARCVITTRLAGYTGPPVPDAHEVELLPFANDDITAAVQAWALPEQAAAELSSRLKDPAVAGMARIPLLLALICSLAADPGMRQPVPRTKAGLYEAVVWQFLSNVHRSTDRGVQAPALDQAGRQNMLRILTCIAISFADTPRGWIDQMPYSRLLEAVRSAGDALADLGGSPPAVLERLLGRAGMLVPVGNPAVREQVYVFLHRTIAEYLVARHLSEQPLPRRMAIVRDHQWFDPDWAEVIPMLGGLLSAAPGEQRADNQLRADARALVSDLLGQKHDPLHRAFFTALRILTQASEPDLLLTAAEAMKLRRDIYRHLKSLATQASLIRLFSDAPSWPQAATDGIIDYLGHLSSRDDLYFPLAVTGDYGGSVIGNAGDILRERKEPAVTVTLLARLTDNKRKVRYWVARVLSAREGPAVTQALIARLDDKDASVRRAAASALENREGPALIQALIGRLDDKDWGVRRAAASALENREGPALIQALIGRLDDKDWGVRRAAASALENREGPALIQALIGRLDDKDWGVRRAAASALENREGPAVTQALIGRLDDKDADMRRAAASALRAREGPAVTQALIAGLDDKDASVRGAAASALRAREGPAVTQALIAGLDDKDASVRGAAASALRAREGPAVTQALIAGLDDKDASVRGAAASALENREGPAVTQALIAGLDDKDARVRHAAASALENREGPAVTQALIAGLDDKDASVRGAAASALAGREGPAVTQALIAGLDDKDAGVRGVAASALENREGPAVTQALIAGLDDKDAGVRGVAASALENREGPAVTQALIAGLDDKDAGVRGVAASALENREGPAVTQALIAGLDDKDARVRHAAASALAGREGLAVTQALIVGLDDKDAGVRGVAASALENREASALTQALIAGLDDKDARVRHAAASALAGRVTQALIAGLDDKDADMRRVAASALAGREGSAVTQALIARLDDKDTRVRHAAASALRAREGPAVTQALIARLDDKDASVRHAAASALGGREGAGVVSALTGRLADTSASVRWTAADVLAARGEPVALDWLCGWRARLALPHKRGSRYQMAERVVNRVYLAMPEERRQLILRRLDRLTRQVSRQGR